ncbi:glycosyltransferase family 39 protein [Pseudoflavonifractor phocaeensis]|uniref:glycosyltransferase family 39 protein n=1 Tax=Pseudoflavonifractor phocaeensis TaxID=1870988 RepID=UPI00195CE8DC|nr:glycosyltransferase family 39 protein [Pseudoflavonifractor phocaeensis]MBM6938842.1 glycosyltransferase family 39 protein [Pseudoflavonifractor phocaeensis]
MKKELHWTSRTGDFCARCTALLCFLIWAAALVQAGRSGHGQALAAGLLLCLPAGWLMFRALSRLKRLGPAKVLTLLTLLCLVCKLAWVLWAVIEPEMDYKTFWDSAQALTTQEVLQGGRYIALFPHIFGYAWFLSLLIGMFGPLSLLAPVTNALLSVCGGLLLFFLVNRRFGFETGCGALVLWTLCPSQTIYNMFVLSEPLYTTLLLGVLALIALFADRWKDWGPVRQAAAGVGTGLLLAAVNFTRPVGAIILIALGLWLALIHADGWRNPPFRRSWLLFCAALVAVYALAGGLGRQYIAARLGEEPSATTGYNILVGLNPDSGGKWNWTDSDALTQANTADRSAQEVQEEMLELAKDRLFSGQVDLLALLPQKLATFLGTDDACTGYAVSVLRHRNELSFLCNAFWYGAIGLSLIALLHVVRTGERSSVQLCILYCIGLTMAQMLVEVAGRYHYSLWIVLAVLAAWGARLLPVPGGKTKE